MINLNMVSPLLEVMSQGSHELRYSCLSIFLAIWGRDHTLFTADLQTLELLSSFDPQTDTLDFYLTFPVSYRFVECVSWMVDHVIDDQLLIDSNILKNLLKWDNRSSAAACFSRLLQNSIGHQEHDALFRYLVDDLEVLPCLVKELNDHSRFAFFFEEDSSDQPTKDVIRAVMRHDKRYGEMVSRIEMMESLRDELMRTN
jgi:hypothetical protein